MCNRSKKSGLKRIDPCMKNIIEVLNLNGVTTLASCCGHGVYPKTIVIDGFLGAYEIFSDKLIPRKKRFYKKDKEGIYYIPEVLK